MISIGEIPSPHLCGLGTLRLSKLGWTQEEIGGVIGKTRQRVQQIANNVDTNIICNSHKEGKSIEEIGEVIGKSQNRVSQIINNVDTNIIDNSYKEGKSVEEIASFNDLD